MAAEAHPLAGCERRRLTADQRRAGILLAARKAFAQRGFHGAGTSEIATAAGCSEPMIYKHFPSKQALFAATLEDATLELRGRIHDALDHHSPGADELGAMAGIANRLCDDEVMLDVARLRMLAIPLADDPQIRAALDLSLSGMRNRVVRVVGEGQERGELRPDADPEVSSWLWVGFVLAAAYRYSVEGKDVLHELPEMPKTLLRMLRQPIPEEASS
jgi:AcrR family transcriptional regulator